MLEDVEDPANGDKKDAQKPRKKRGEGVEAQRVNSRLAGFNLEESEAWKSINKQFTIGVTHTELKSIAQLICGLAGLRLDRDASRDNRVLVKWFDENWAAIKPFIGEIHLRDEKEAVIGA